jgi:hypothetical protein
MKKIITAILLVLVIASCKKEDLSYQGPPFVDFPYTNPNLYLTIKGNIYSDITVPISVRLVGPQNGSPYNVTFEVDTTSTAKSGIHYSIDGTTIQIPAKSSYGEIPVKFLIPSFPEQTSVKLVINLTGGDLKVNPNYKQIVLNIYRQGFIDLFLGSYSCEEPDKPVSVKYDVKLDADTSVKNRIKISNFWGYAKDDSKVYIDLKSSVDSVYLPSQTFTDQLNRIYTVSGNGKYNINDGSIRISYSLSQNGSSYTDSGEQIYKRK